MRWFFVMILIFCIIFSGCSSQNVDENSESKNSIVQITESNVEDEVLSSVFRVSDNYLIQEDKEIRIEGRVIQNESDASSLDARFDDAEEKNGIFPSYGMVTLKFEDEIPIKVLWSINDGISASDSNKKKVIDRPQNETSINIGVSEALELISNYEAIPNRKLRIVCQYRTYSVEYLLVISASPMME